MKRKIYSREISKKEIKKIKDEYLSNGFVIIRKIIKKSFLNRLIQKAEIIAKTKPDDFIFKNVHLFENGRISSIHNLITLVPDYEKLTKVKPIELIFKEIYGTPAKSNFNSSFFAKPAKIGLATKLHQDNAFFCFDPPEAMTCWIPVDKSNKKNGAVHYYKGSQIENDIPHIPKGNLGASMTINHKSIEKIKRKYPKVIAELSKGDCIIHDPHVVHGSERNIDNSDRRAFNFSIKSKNARRNKVKYYQYRNNLEKFINLKKKLN